uniref:hypothetical protein n=1 Tax=Roseivirga sp. TaxID=1964215 RepID=UPI004047EF2A
MLFGELSALRALCGKKEVAILTLPQSTQSNAKDFIEQALSLCKSSRLRSFSEAQEVPLCFLANLAPFAPFAV